MIIVTECSQWQEIRKTLAHKSIGLVHTMGNLHPGHISLCQRSQKDNEVTVVAIFVNQTQFNNPDDYRYYPRTLEQDKQLLHQQKVDYLFIPTYEDMYPDNYQIQVLETGEIGAHLEGEHRLGHFTGMLTIVLKHLNVIRPTHSYYGEKDYQQLMLIEKMAKALFLPVTIVGCPTIRADNGLALSSRNNRLSEESRVKAAKLPVILRDSLTVDDAFERLTDLGFKVDYVCDRWDRRLAAVWLDNVRLIDNIAHDKLGKRETSNIKI
ncbi:unnamed protein product [Oppiella nova]|uniref:Pantoate--beta-alanine ligase n=1 Tax=Oppiella nova TaxID=334625 RepID=A0A7R9QV32_9ACAR|nr:unnamed protein product [Oppiella nova]CAG2176672.1 unnamed protein product [Oppiella nova]